MNCCICHKEIADCSPPLCANVECEKLFRIKVNYNKWAKEQAEIEAGVNFIMDTSLGGE